MRGFEAAIACVVLVGCDGVFGLQHIYKPPDALLADMRPGDAPADVAPRDVACSPAGSSLITKRFGARPGDFNPGGAADTFLSSDTTSNRDHANFGGLDKLFVCFQCSCATDCESISGGNDDVVTILRFDLGTEIPPCSMVQTATLTLHTTGDALSGGSSVVAYNLLEDWEEGISFAPTGAIGTASWAERTSMTMWSTAGAGASSHSPTPATIGSYTPAAADADNPATLNPSVVQAWVDNPASNHGLVLMITGSTSEVHFHSRESGSMTKRPALTVGYRTQ